MPSSVSSTRATIEHHTPSLNAFNHAGNAERPSKRARLSDDAFAAIHTPSASEDVALEVDHMILDYTVYQAIEACLASRNRRSSVTSLSASLSMVNTFLPVFKARHPAYAADPELKFRIKLLKLVTLFTQRFTRNPATPHQTALDALRESNRNRAFEWIQSTTEIPSSAISSEVLDVQFPRPSHELEANRAHVLRELDIPPEDKDAEEPFYGASTCVSLLDIVKLFMEVSAARNTMNGSNLSEIGMHLAAEFMLQACLEQYLIVGAEGSDAIDLAFSWGYQSQVDDELESASDINDMFKDEDIAKEVEGWSDIKRSYLAELLPPNEHRVNPDIDCYLNAVAAKFPIAEFEASILQYLEALASISKPVLLQLETGKLDGMTEQQTESFLGGCGLNLAKLFQS